MEYRRFCDTYGGRLTHRRSPNVNLKGGENYVPVGDHYGYKESQYSTIYFNVISSLTFRQAGSPT